MTFGFVYFSGLNRAKIAQGFEKSPSSFSIMVTVTCYKLRDVKMPVFAHAI